MVKLRLPAIPISHAKNVSFLIFLLIIPYSSVGAEIRTLEVALSFNTQADPDKRLLGYRLYQNGRQVCETNDPIATMITCVFPTEDGTFDFTLKAHYSDGSVSPSSPSFPHTITSNTLSPPTPPTAVIHSATATGNAPLYVTFDGSSSTTPNPPIVRYSWAFGDGSLGTGRTASHAYTAAGTYSSRLTVVDSKGLSNTVSTPIVVSAVSPPANIKPTAVISADATSGVAPLTISFNGSQSTDTDGFISAYKWTFGDGATGSGPTIQHSYTNVGTYSVSLQVTDNKGDIATTRTSIFATQPPAGNPIKLEMGEVSIDNDWATVAFDNTYIAPVVVAGPPTINGDNPALIRIRNVNKNGFQVRIQEWNYKDVAHAPEKFSYMVIEKGIYTLNDGSKMEAGTFIGRETFQQIPLQQQYDNTPVILTQVSTENETDAVTGRLHNINQNSFEYMLQQMEASASSNLPETIGYIAWEPGKGDISGLLYEVGVTAQGIDHTWSALTFETEFPGLPFFIAGMQSTIGSDTAVVRTKTITQTGAWLMVQEEQSKDQETWHFPEVVGYLAIGLQR